MRFMAPLLQSQEQRECQYSLKFCQEVLKHGKMKKHMWGVLGITSNCFSAGCPCWQWGYLFIYLFIYLNDLTDDEIHFYGGENNGQPPDWYKHYIINFQNYSTHRDAFTWMYNACGVMWGKVTHLCKAGTDYASFNGCNQDEIAQMSKHEKRSWICHICLNYPLSWCTLSQGIHWWGQTMRHGTMSEFIMTLTVTGEVRGWGCSYCFHPCIDCWCQEVWLTWGDRGKAAFNFLWKKLLYLSEVILQDGIYWVNELPQHEVSLRLRQLRAMFSRHAMLKWKWNGDHHTKGKQPFSSWAQAAKQHSTMSCTCKSHNTKSW